MRALAIVVSDQRHIWVMLAATALLVFFGSSGFRLSRWEGTAFLVAYATYVWYLVSLSSPEIPGPPALS